MGSQNLHAPLKHDRCTRVLILEPARDRAAPIICTLQEIEVDQLQAKKPLQAYDALSYVWGYPVGDKKITCNGHPLLITQNCLTALTYLRLKDGPRKLWVDAICIDQKSIEERSKQVKLMGDVYRNAGKVLMWFGEGDKATWEMFARIRRIAMVARTKDSVTATEKYDSFINRALKLTAPQFQALESLFDHEWWQRIWTLQEFTLASRPWLMCGAHLLQQTDLDRALSIIMGDSRVGYSNAWEVPLANFHLRKCISLFSKNVSPEAVELDLGTVMMINSAAKRKATDSKDKIYGLYQMLQRFGITVPEPNYSLAATQIFEDASFAIIQGTESLRIFEELQERVHQHTELPSWVPAFGDVRSQRIRRRQYRPSVHYGDRVPIHEPGRLILKGRSIGKLSKFGSRLPAVESDDYPKVGAPLLEWLVLNNTVEPKEGDEDNRFELFLKTISHASYSVVNNPKNSPLEQQCRSELEDFFAELGQLMILETERVNGIPRINPKFHKMLYLVWAEIQDCQFLMTDAGDAGVTMAEGSEGDLAVLFPGASLPFILRKLEEHGTWRFIGVAHGMYRYDEVLGKNLQDEKELETFVLI